MYKLIQTLSALLLILYSSNHSYAFQTSPKALTDLINHPVGGIWVSQNNTNNATNPEDYKSFWMSFKNGINKSSVFGEIHGIKNNGDSTMLMEVWNFISPSDSSVLLVQNTIWGEYGIGNIQLLKGKHMDIAFKSVTADGQVYYTRDIHYITSKNEMRAETFQKMKEEEAWKKVGESLWKRINQKNNN